MSKKMKKSMHLLIYLGLGAVFGFMISTRAVTESLSSLRFEPTLYYTYDLAFGLAALLMVGLAIWTIVGLVRLPAQPLEDEASEEETNRQEYLLSKLMLSSLYCVIVSLTWLFTALAYASSSAAVPEDSSFIVTNLIASVIATFGGTFLQFRTVQVYNRYFPARTLDLLGKNGAKEFFDKLDEAERYIVYRSAFSAYKAVNVSLIIGMFGFVLYSILVAFNPMPILALGVIWIIQQTVYYWEASKYYRNK